jgi:aminopeptidase I
MTAPRQAAAQAAPSSLPANSKNFVIADMDGRSSRDNRACASCISKLTPSEIGQVNWHLAEHQACRLCQIAACQPEAFTKPFCDFLQENPTVFHTVDYFKRKLTDCGFTEVRRDDTEPHPCPCQT